MLIMGLASKEEVAGFWKPPNQIMSQALIKAHYKKGFSSMKLPFLELFIPKIDV